MQVRYTKCMNDTMKELDSKRRKKKIIIGIVIAVVAITIASILIGYFVWKKRNDFTSRYDTDVEVFNFLIEQAAETPLPSPEERAVFDALLKMAN